MRENGTLLRVDDLAVEFDTDEGVVHAVNGISYELNSGDSLGIVGESGCGKSVSSLAVMGLVNAAGRKGLSWLNRVSRSESPRH